MSSSNGHPRKTNRAQQRDADARTPPPGRPVAKGQFSPDQVTQAMQPPAPPSLEGVNAEFERLVGENQARFAELAAAGTPPDPFYLVHARINHLIEAIAQATGPNGPRWAAMTRLGFEKVIAAELAEAGPATRRMQLAEGGRYTPEMIRALAAQTGTLRRRPQ